VKIIKHFFMKGLLIVMEREMVKQELKEKTRELD